MSDIDYVNAHGTSTPMGDEIELGAVERLFGNAGWQARHVVDQVGDRASAGRGRRGRGRVLACLPSATTSRRRRSTWTIRRSNTAIDLVPHTAKKREINTVLSNSFGFGGTNASLILRKVA